MEPLQQQIENARGLDDLYPALAASRMTAGWHKKQTLKKFSKFQGSV